VTHPILKGAYWVLHAERSAGAPEAMYGAECMRCDAASGWVDNDVKPVGMWALTHTQQLGLDHSQFIVTTQTHWRVDSRLRDDPPPPRPRPPRSPARPRREPFGMMVAWATRWSAPLRRRIGWLRR
jgi:hypothetical protein